MNMTKPKPQAPQLPVWWTGQGTEPVRCIACVYWRGRHGWCSEARRQANSARMWRRCESFLEAPQLVPAQRQAPNPFERARRELSRLGLLDRVSELRDLGSGTVGVRVKKNVSDAQAGEVFDAVEFAMRAKP